RVHGDPELPRRLWRRPDLRPAMRAGSPGRHRLAQAARDVPSEQLRGGVPVRKLSVLVMVLLATAVSSSAFAAPKKKKPAPPPPVEQEEDTDTTSDDSWTTNDSGLELVWH